MAFTHSHTRGALPLRPSKCLSCLVFLWSESNMSQFAGPAYAAKRSARGHMPNSLERMSAAMKFLSALVLLTPLLASAQSRGGSCSAPACNVTASIVFVALLFFFIGSLYDSVREKGLLAGIASSRAVRLVLGYVVMLVSVLGVPVPAEALWGRGAAMWALGTLVVGLVVGPVVARRLLLRARSPERP